MSALRKQYPAIAYGDWQIINTQSKHLLAIRYDWNGKSMITLHNFSNRAQDFLLRPGKPSQRLHNIFLGNTLLPEEDKYSVSMPGLGYAWFTVE